MVANMSNRNALEPEFGWYMPTRGDGPYIGVKPDRVVDTAYLNVSES